MTSAIDFHPFPERAAWTEAIVATLAAGIERIFLAQREVCVAAAGGRTPEPILQALAALPLPWERLTFVPTDDRLVPPTHPARNLAFLARGIAPALDAGAKILALEDAPKGFVPDLVLLGMGGDGHFASIFPHGAGMAQALDAEGAAHILRVTPEPLPEEAPFPRITLTLPALMAAHEILLAVTGETKRVVIEKAAENSTLPISRLLAQTKVPVRIYWSP